MFCVKMVIVLLFFFSSRRRHTRSDRDWSSDVCSSDLHLRLARDVDVLEEVHLELLKAVSLARLAPPTGNVEGEGPSREAKGPGLGLGGEQLADLVERLDVGDRVRARGAPDWLLIDQPHASQIFEALQ